VTRLPRIASAAPSTENAFAVLARDFIAAIPMAKQAAEADRILYHPAAKLGDYLRIAITDNEYFQLPTRRLWRD
jgi:hypothetical protein